MVQDMKLFAKTHKNALLVNAVMVCICYLHMAFSQNVGIDTERIIVAEGPLLDSWKTVGRQGLLLSKMIGMPGGYNPYLSGMIFLLGFMLLGALIGFLCWTVSGRDDGYPYGLFMALFAVCPVWMPQFYFALQRAEVVLGMIYAVISVFALSRLIYDKWGKGRMVIWAVFGLAFGVWSFCTYQGCVAFYIGLCIMVFLMDFAKSYREKQWREYAWAILGLIGGFAAVYVVNMAITKIFFGQGQYLQGQIVWGQASISDIIHNILRHVKNVLFWENAVYRSVYPLVCVCLAIVWIAFCFKREYKISIKVVFTLALAGLLLTPFLLTIYMGNEPAVRSQFALQLIAAFGCMFAYGIWSRQDARKCLWGRRAVMAVCVVAIWFSVATNLRLLYTDDVRNQEDLRVAGQIAQDIQRMKGADNLPIICVGGYEARLNEASERVDMYGVSFLSWDYTPASLAGATGRVVGIMNTMGIDINGTLEYQDEAIELAKEMAHYPHNGYISVQDSYVIVKLSDIK